MRRIVNFRAPLFCAIGLILGIFSFYEFLFGDILFGIIGICLIFAIGLFLFLIKSRTWLGVIAVLLSFVLGYGLSQLNYCVINKNEANGAVVTITGRVCDLGRNGEENNAYYLENCQDDSGTKYGGRIETYIFDNENISTGTILTIKGTLNSVYPVKGEVNVYNLRKQIRYQLNVDAVLSRAEGSLKLDETIRKYIYDATRESAPQSGDVLYALLTGDRNALSAEKETAFKSAGIIHTLAVSGLHVGFVVAVFCFILKRFKLRPLVECAILLVPLIFYAYICSFAPSVIRAIAMVACSYLARELHGRYDMITSLSLAAIVILIISPFNLFDVGFQLSALSVFGIATLHGAINRVIFKRKIPVPIKYLIDSFAISLSCSVATFFVMQINFGYAPILGILLNVLVIPLVTVAFVLGWLGLIPWIFRYILLAADWILQVVVVIAKWVGSLSFATVAVPAVAAAIVVVAVWLFIAGGYVNLRKVGKIVAHSVCAGALVLCIGLSFVKLAPKSQAYVSYGYDSAVCVVTSADGQAAIAGDFSNRTAYLRAAQYLNRYKITGCTLYLTDCDNAQTELLADALKLFPVDKAYKLDNSFSGAVEEVLADYNVTLVTMLPNSTVGDGVKVTSIYNGSLSAMLVNTDGLSIAVVYGNENNVRDYLTLNIPSHVYVLDNACKEYSDSGLTTLSRYQSTLPYNYGANKYGTFTITQKGDTINIKFR